MLLTYNYLYNLKKKLPFIKLYILNNELIGTIPVKYVYEFIFFLKFNENSKFDILIDICAADFPQKKNRFEVIYNLLSLSYGQRFKIKTYTNETISINSIQNIFKNANWSEREV